MDPGTLRTAVARSPGAAWLAAGVESVSANPPSITRLFPAAGRHCGRAAGQAARALLLLALPPDEMPGYVDELYRHGDAAEKLAVLEALPLLPIGDAAAPLLHDAVRTNDTRLIAAALGPYAAHLDQSAWRQAVLKCVFLGIPLAAVHGLAGRADAELAAMAAGLRDEREAAGRPVSDDALALLRLPT